MSYDKTDLMSQGSTVIVVVFPAGCDAPLDGPALSWNESNVSNYLKCCNKTRLAT